MMKKIIATILVVILSAGILSACINNVKFDDVTEQQKFYIPVTWAAELKMIQGSKDRLFRPDEPCTRGDFIEYIWIMSGKPKYDFTPPGEVKEEDESVQFTDVTEKMPSYDAIMWAEYWGMISGYDDGTFRPDEPLLRRHAAAIIWRLAGKPIVEDDAECIFTDADKNIKGCLVWESSAGITETGETIFRPDDPCLRKEAVTFLYNYDLWLKGYESMGKDISDIVESVLKDRGRELYDGYCWSRDIPYVHELPIFGSYEAIAAYSFTVNYGDCLGKAATFCFMARELGFDAHIVRGVIPLAIGGWADHFWVEIDEKDGTYVYDPHFEQKTGSDGFRFKYGDEDSWRYTAHKRVY